MDNYPGVSAGIARGQTPTFPPLLLLLPVRSDLLGRMWLRRERVGKIRYPYPEPTGLYTTASLLRRFSGAAASGDHWLCWASTSWEISYDHPHLHPSGETQKQLWSRSLGHGHRLFQTVPRGCCVEAPCPDLAGRLVLTAPSPFCNFYWKEVQVQKIFLQWSAFQALFFIKV